MKGKLIKIEERWMVGTVCYADMWSNYIPLHPDDVKQINRDAQLFDNIEARIATYPNVEFEILIEEETSEYYAKLIPSKEQQKQLITEIMDLDAKDGLYEDDINRLVKKSTDAFVKRYNKHLEIRQYAYGKGFTDGYNKAKEETDSIFANILDHLCDKMESISQEQINNDNFQLARYRTFKYLFEYIQSLNVQPIKAKETLYTEEQVREVIGRAQLLNHNDEFAFTEEYLIQSLKQPKQ